MNVEAMPKRPTSPSLGGRRMAPMEAAAPDDIRPQPSAPRAPASTPYSLSRTPAPAEANVPEPSAMQPGPSAYSRQPERILAPPDDASAQPRMGGADPPMSIAETADAPPEREAPQEHAGAPLEAGTEPPAGDPLHEAGRPAAESPPGATESLAEAAMPEAAPDTPAAGADPSEADAQEAVAVTDEPDPAAAAMTSLPYVEEGEDSMAVTVFYGTDRAAIETEKITGADFGAWYLLTVLAGGGTLALFAVAVWKKPLRWPRRAAAGGLAITVLLAGWSGYLKATSGPAESRTIRGYSNERGRLEMGTCRVTIPKTHEVGELESPSIVRLEFREDERKHVVLQDVVQVTREKFFAKLEDCVDRCGREEAFVFIHGYNVTFEDAARRTAQLAFDLQFQGAPIFYSWPSQGGLLQYAVDETNVVWTVPHLKEFLVGVAENSGAKSVHVIAHSMGNRALTAALHQVSYEYRNREPMFGEVVLTAPDVDAEVFRRDLAPAIVDTADRVTLYASSNDEALIASKRVHGYPRAGDSGSDLVVVPGIDTIDVSDIDTSLLGHSYYGSNHTVITDMAHLLHEAAPPERRTWLQSMNRGALRYWKFLRERLSQARETARGSTTQ
jgi:esterase/lipase superfamily enzyme